MNKKSKLSISIDSKKNILKELVEKMSFYEDSDLEITSYQPEKNNP